MTEVILQISVEKMVYLINGAETIGFQSVVKRWYSDNIPLIFIWFCLEMKYFTFFLLNE